MQKSSLKYSLPIFIFLFFSLSVKVKETHLLQASPQPYSHPGVSLHLAAAPSALVPPDGSFNYLGSVCTVWPRIARTQPEIGWGPSWVTLLNSGCSGIPNPNQLCCTRGVGKALPSINHTTLLQSWQAGDERCGPNTVPRWMGSHVGWHKLQPSPLLCALNMSFSLNKLGTRWAWSQRAAEKQSINTLHGVQTVQ